MSKIKNKQTGLKHYSCLVSNDSECWKAVKLYRHGTLKAKKTPLSYFCGRVKWVETKHKAPCPVCLNDLSLKTFPVDLCSMKRL